MKKLLKYINNVYQINGKINSLKDFRKRISIPTGAVVHAVLLGFLLQYQSFKEIFSYETTRKRLRHYIKERIPKIDAARKVLKLLNKAGLSNFFDDIVKKIYNNKTMRHGTIDGYTVAAIDGLELFSSEKKSCADCLTRTHSNEKTEYYHSSVVCMTVGNDPHIIIGQEMRHPRDGNDKDEGENTAGKRLLKRLYKTFHHFADVIIGDALYLNSPFINTVFSIKMDFVIRSKDEKRVIIKDAAGLFKKQGQRESFTKNNVNVDVWDLSGFEMDGVNKKLRVLKFVEKHPKEKSKRIVWVVTSLLCVDYKTIWTMMHKRWDIELNGFHQLKTYYHADHCFEHDAVETIFILNIMAFNLREMFLFKRVRNFRDIKMTRCEVTTKFRDDLLINDFRVLWDTG